MILFLIQILKRGLFRTVNLAQPWLPFTNWEFRGIRPRFCFASPVFPGYEPQKNPREMEKEQQQLQPQSKHPKDTGHVPASKHVPHSLFLPLEIQLRVSASAISIP